ncbi:GNAT family N-acetyltransferase [Arcobacter sp. KX21116]|uniref:GNAT family N-acetyltransferase n=1 Tax=Arcobacter iocasae TaxID=2906515 RepID=UPI0035D3FF61
MEVVTLSRDEYLESVQKLSHFENLKFLKNALDLWDNYYSWEKFPPLALKVNNRHVTYLFYNISKNNKYLTINNILTPFKYRRNGYAYKLLKYLFSSVKPNKIERCKLYSVNNSIKFYNKLGLRYWGVTKELLYYSDFKMPEDIKEIEEINYESSTDEFNDMELEDIHNKLKDNANSFDEKEILIHEDCLKLMKTRFKFDDLSDEIKKRDLD